MNTRNKLIALSLIALGGGVINAAPEAKPVAAPEAIKIVEPEVPYTQTRCAVEETVVVTFQINRHGQPMKIRFESYDDRTYADRVAEAVRQWRFKAPEEVEVTYRQVFKFS